MKTNAPFNLTIKFMQYGVNPEADQYVHQCYFNADGSIVKLSPDISDRPDEIFFAVETKDGWEKIENRDLVVLENGKPSVCPLALFLLNPPVVYETPKSKSYGLFGLVIVD